MRIKTIVVAIAAIMASGAGVLAAGVTIEQSGQLFSEKSVSLKIGDTITFANHDDVTHNINVINDNDDATDLGVAKAGERN